MPGNAIHLLLAVPSLAISRHRQANYNRRCRQSLEIILLSSRQRITFANQTPVSWGQSCSFGDEALGHSCLQNLKS